MLGVLTTLIPLHYTLSNNDSKTFVFDSIQINKYALGEFFLISVVCFTKLDYYSYSLLVDVNFQKFESWKQCWVQEPIYLLPLLFN